MSSRHEDDRERVSRRGVQDEAVFTPRGGGGTRSIHDRLGDRAAAASPPRKRTTSIDDDNGPKRRRLSATNVKPTEDDPKLLQRSRRMFGALMGHLGRAKKQLAQDSDLLKKQDRLLSAAEEKEKQHRRVVQQQQARRKLDSQIAAHKRDAVDKIAKLERKHALSISSERHQARFLQTVSPIPIFYLPARHTKETQALVDASMEAIEEKILAQRREIDAKKRSIEAESQRKIEALEAELARLVDTKPGDGPRDDVPTDVTTSPRDIASPSENDDVVQADEPSNRDDESEANEAKKDATVRDDNSPAAVEGASAQATPLSPQGASSSVEKPPSPVKKSPSPVKMPSPAKTPPSPVKAPSAEQQESCDDAIESKQEVSEGMDDDAKTESVEGDHAETKDASAAPALIPSKLKVVELRQHLKARGLDTKGLKDDLVKRLEQALAN